MALTLSRKLPSFSSSELCRLVAAATSVAATSASAEDEDEDEDDVACCCCASEAIPRPRRRGLVDLTSLTQASFM